MLLSLLLVATLILNSFNTPCASQRQLPPFSSGDAFSPNFDFSHTHLYPTGHGGGEISGNLQNPNYGYGYSSPYSTQTTEHDSGYSYSSSWKGIRGSENLEGHNYDNNGIHGNGASMYGEYEHDSGIHGGYPSPTAIRWGSTPSSEYAYIPSHQIAQFESSSYESPSHHHPSKVYGSENYEIQDDAPYKSVYDGEWRGMLKLHTALQNPSHEPNYHQSGYNYNPHFHPHPLQPQSSSSHGSSQLNPIAPTEPEYNQFQNIRPTISPHKPYSTPYANDYFTPDALSPSYAPPRSLLKSVFNGISSSISSSLKPALEYLSPSSETWRPLNHQTDPVPPLGLHQDHPHPHGEKDAESSKSTKHIYIHSSSDKFPEEVNLKLILLKPSSSIHELQKTYEEDAAVRPRLETPSVPSHFPAPFPLSDLKRSKINAQLYFVRYKSPFVPRSQHWESHPFPAKTPTFHFLVSKRSSEQGSKTQ